MEKPVYDALLLIGSMMQFQLIGYSHTAHIAGLVAATTPSVTMVMSLLDFGEWVLPWKYLWESVEGRLTMWAQKYQRYCLLEQTLKHGTWSEWGPYQVYAYSNMSHLPVLHVLASNDHMNTPDITMSVWAPFRRRLGYVWAQRQYFRVVPNVNHDLRLHPIYMSITAEVIAFWQLHRWSLPLPVMDWTITERNMTLWVEPKASRVTRVLWWHAEIRNRVPSWNPMLALKFEPQALSFPSGDDQERFHLSVALSGKCGVSGDFIEVEFQTPFGTFLRLTTPLKLFPRLRRTPPHTRVIRKCPPPPGVPPMFVPPPPLSEWFPPTHLQPKYSLNYSSIRPDASGQGWTRREVPAEVQSRRP